MMNKGGLYFHIPFCLKKCDYCDFCSFPAVSEEQKKRYAQAMITEMAAYSERAKDVVFDTLFFGGGTPTLLGEKDTFAILSAAHRYFSVSRDAEITIESNPATADEKKLSYLREMGINRLSIGVQSLSDAELSALGRVHTADEALRFYETAVRVGFSNINIDLMYGIPHQTEESARETLARVLALAPTHVSAYSLILEEGTPLFNRRDGLPIPTEEGEEALHTLVREMLTEAGYTHYEISNYAKDGYACRHNLHYWHSEPYLGFGVSAYSFFEGARYGNGHDLTSYLTSPLGQVTDRERVDAEALSYEWVMLRLRLAEGLPLDDYENTFGVRFEKKYAPLIEKYEKVGLMQVSDGRLWLTEQGMRLSNAILVDFLS